MKTIYLGSWPRKSYQVITCPTCGHDKHDYIDVHVYVLDINDKKKELFKQDRRSTLHGDFYREDKKGRPMIQTLVFYGKNAKCKRSKDGKYKLIKGA
jgi:hypothetical protein